MFTIRAIAAAAAILGCCAPCSAIVIGAGSVNSLNVTYGTPVSGVDLSGVVQVLSSAGSCSGSLLSDGFSILTAGHCVVDPTPGGFTVMFMGPSGFVSEGVSSVFVDPAWTGDLSGGSDLAVLRLSASAPSSAARYDLFSGTPNVGTTVDLVAGYGYSGTGSTGYVAGTYGTLRAGTNVYEAMGGHVGDDASLLLAQLYESSLASTNVLNAAHPYSSATEAGIAPGDSGGPTFQNGYLVGVHHTINCFVNSFPNCSSPHTALDASYGQFFEDTNVSTNIVWISQQEVSSVAPEPSTAALALTAILLLWLARLRSAGALRQAQQTVRSRVRPYFHRA